MCEQTRSQIVFPLTWPTASNGLLTLFNGFKQVILLTINHVNLCTNNVASITNIFSHHFAFEVVEARDDFATLRGSDGFLLVLTKIAPDSFQTYPYTFFPQANFRFNFHVGFMIGSPEEVHAKHKELSEAGLKPGPISEYQALGAAWTAFYCPVGDGIDVEVNAHVPAEKTLN